MRNARKIYIEFDLWGECSLITEIGLTEAKSLKVNQRKYIPTDAK
jgi:hypothetical protein